MSLGPGDRKGHCLAQWGLRLFADRPSKILWEFLDGHLPCQLTWLYCSSWWPRTAQLTTSQKFGNPEYTGCVLFWFFGKNQGSLCVTQDVRRLETRPLRVSLWMSVDVHVWAPWPLREVPPTCFQIIRAGFVWGAADFCSVLFHVECKRQVWCLWERGSSLGVTMWAPQGWGHFCLVDFLLSLLSLAQ